MSDSHTEPGKERLQKILARAGYGSRRACEELIVEGRVTINNQTVSMLGTRADPLRDVVAVDGERLRLPGPAYWILNKKEGDSFGDDEDALNELIPGENGRLFTAGRLDRASRGLVLITNDGRVANLLTHPRYKVPKVYRLNVKGSVSTSALRNFERALYYAFRGGRFEELNTAKRSASGSHVLITVYAGLPASLRDIFLKYGHAIKSVSRERIGCIELRDLAPGQVRKLRGDEVGVLLGYSDEAEAGRLHYEGKVVGPANFPRDEGARDFRRKKTGARTTSAGGQKRVSARVRSEGSRTGGSPQRKSSGTTPRKSSGAPPRKTGGAAPRKSGGAAPRKSSGAPQRKSGGAPQRKSSGAAPRKSGGAPQRRTGGKPRSSGPPKRGGPGRRG
jgi:23S rRNA pseudouridine2605 synthase